MENNQSEHTHLSVRIAILLGYILYVAPKNNDNNNIKDYRLPKQIMKSFKFSKNYKNVTQRHEMTKCCWENGFDRLAQCRVTTKLQFVKNTVSAKHNNTKCDKMRYAGKD